MNLDGNWCSAHPHPSTAAGHLADSLFLHELESMVTYVRQSLDIFLANGFHQQSNCIKVSESFMNLQRRNRFWLCLWELSALLLLF